ncbi:hypothetical protein PTKIN_Ptkin08bG0086100 [Pterospermum kingtungense]
MVYMAQLPPKIPNMTPNWDDMVQQRMPCRPNGSISSSTNTNATSQSQWVDEFLDFSSARRGTHRHSISDSIAFLEDSKTANNEFENFDDEQFMSMFTDDMPDAVAPCTPSDDEDQKQQHIRNESEVVESQCKKESQSDRIIDPKRVKRILGNRQSAQRSRVRKLQYISELERSVTSLQAEVSVLSPRVAFLDHQRLLLNVDNSALKQRIAALAQDKIFKDGNILTTSTLIHMNVLCTFFILKKFIIIITGYELRIQIISFSLG